MRSRLRRGHACVCLCVTACVKQLVQTHCLCVTHAHAHTHAHLYSGRMSIAAYSNAVFFMPARLHSMMVDVRMGTTCLGNLEMDLRLGQGLLGFGRACRWAAVVGQLGGHHTGGVSGTAHTRTRTRAPRCRHPFGSTPCNTMQLHHRHHAHLATRTSMRAAAAWSSIATRLLTRMYECSSMSDRSSSVGGRVSSASSCRTVLNSLVCATR